EVCDLLDRYGAAFCEHDLVSRRPPRITGGFRYLRFHGAQAKYQGRYGRELLQPVAEELSRWSEENRAASAESYVYFNNDTSGHAVMDALELLELVGEPARAQPLEVPSQPSGQP